MPAGRKRITSRSTRPFTKSRTGPGASPIRELISRSTSGSSVRKVAPTTGPVEDRGAAHHRVDQHVHHAGEGVGAGRDHEGVVGLQRAGQAGEGGAQRQHGELVARRVDAHGPGRRLVLADGLEGVPHAGAADPPEHEEGREERQVDHPDGGALGDGREAEGAVREVEVHEEEAHHLAEADGGDGQEDPLQPQDGQAQGDGDQGGEEGGHRQVHEEGGLGVEGEDGRRVGADGHEGRLGQRELSAGEGGVHG